MRIVCLLQSLDLDDTKTITMEELAEGLRKQGSPVAQKELEARARRGAPVVALV